MQWDSWIIICMSLRLKLLILIKLLKLVIRMKSTVKIHEKDYEQIIQFVLKGMINPASMIKC